jgi:hypothetical protein
MTKSEAGGAGLMGEPRTDAGRRMAGDLADKEWPVVDDILAIEAEAAAIDPQRLQEAMERTALRHANPENRAPGWGVIAREVAVEYARLSLDEAEPARQHGESR